MKTLALPVIVTAVLLGQPAFAQKAAVPAPPVAEDPHSGGDALRRIFGTSDFRALRARAFAIGTAEKKKEEAQRKALDAAGLAASPSWSLVGPTFLREPSYTSANAYANAGLVANLALHPTDPNTLWIATAGGGVWKTADGGATWIPTMDNQLILPVGAVAVAKDAPNRVFAGSGCGDYSSYYQDFPGVGLLISTDGGGTWRTSQTSPGSKFYDLMVVDGAGNVILAATELGVRRSTDGGDTWSAANPADRAVSLARGSDPITIFAGTFKNGNEPPGSVWKSTDGGVTFTETATGLPGTATSRGRPRIAVAPSDPTRVYVLFSDKDGSTLDMVRSTDAGNTWTAVNLLGANPPVTILGTQGTTMIGLAVDPASANTLVAGGLDTWKSTDAGSTWTKITDWTGPNPPYSYVHADVHSIVFRPTGELYVASDGGIYKSTNGGSSFATLNRGLSILQLYYVCQTPANVNLVAGGAQDNGTAVRFSGGEFLSQVGGDGFGCYINGSDPNILIGSAQNEAISRSTDGGATFRSDAQNFGLSDGQPSGVALAGSRFFTTIRRHPIDPAHVYALSKQKLWESTDGGASWKTPSGDIPGVTELQDVYILPTDGSRILLLDSSGAVLESLDGGKTFTTKGNAGAFPVRAVRYDRTDVKRLYAVSAATTAGTARFSLSTDGGATWTTTATGLPDVPLLTVEQDVLDAKTLYAGTYIGVYRSTDSGATWATFGTGLPNVMVLDIAQLPSGKIRAGTFGRAIWEIDPSGGGTGLAAAFTFSPASPTAGAPVQFTDQSTGSPTTWQWSFGDSGTSTAQNPTYTYAAAGTYQAQLTVGNGTTTNSTTKSVVVAPATAGCATSGTTLCLQNRFRLSVNWKNPYDTGTTGVGTAVSLTSDSGYFWFFSASNIELVLKILDGRSVNGKFWVFYGALSDVEYTITITDTQNGNVKTYFNPGKHLASVADVNAFPGSRPGAAEDGFAVMLIPADYGQLASWQLAHGGREQREAALAKRSGAAADVRSSGRSPLAACVTGGDTLCLNQSRFQLKVSWTNYNDGSTGSGIGVKLTDDSGYFWFFSASNLELMLKVLDGTGVNGKFWVFYGALSDVGYTITVTDTQTGTVKTYTNPPHTLASVADTSAF